MRYANLFIAVLLLLIAALQWNDPDPLYWIAVYAGGGAVAIGRAMGRYSGFWTALLTGAVLAGLVIALPGTWQYLVSGNYGSILGDMRPDNYVEPAREFFGLLLLLGVLVYYVRTADRQRP